jgi:hypothetical protein
VYNKAILREELIRMMYGIEYFEMVDTFMSEVQEWEDYLADMETNPYDDPRI